MRRFLLLLSILCSVFISKVQAQEPRLTAPKNVCLNGYATMHAFLTSGTEDLVNWKITYPDGTILNHRITWQNNYPDGHHPDFRYMSSGAGQSVTFDVKQIGTYTVTITIRRNGNWSAERTKTFNVYDCTMDECEGTFTPSTNFKETFGTFATGGPRREVELPATIEYEFLSSGSLTDNEYSIYYNSRLGGRPEWDNVGDHTDNGNGGMLIANSYYDPKLFYRRPVNGLCPGAKYNFSAWFINLNSLTVLNSTCETEDYRYAGVTFIVRNASDNSIIKQFNTYDVSMDLSRNLPGDQRLTGWQQFGGTVTLAPGEENVVVEIMNNNPGGCGNDIAVDDIEFVFCAPKIYSYIDGLGVDNDMVCPGAELTITSKIEPADYFEDPVYVWEMNKNGAGWGPVTEPGYTYPNGDSILHIGPGVLQELDYIQYRLYVFERNNVNTRGCYTPGNMVTISVPQLPTIIASRPRICRGDTTTLTATPLEGPGITGYETFEFSGPNILTWPTLPAPKDKVMVTPVVTSTYEVTGSILYGQYGNGQPRVCQKEANITIEVDQPPVVNVGPDQRVCVNEPVTLDAGAANAVYPILWQPTNATTQTITVNAPGVSSTQAYRVTVTNGECKVSDTVNITAVAYPEATIVSQAAFCNTNPIPLVAVEPDPGYSGEWTIIGDDHGASIDDPTSYDNALLLNMPFDQPVTVRWTVTADGTDCSDYAEQDIIRESRPVSTPGPNQTSCTNVFTLAANAPANATMQGTWSVSGGGTATFGDIHDPNTTATITSGVGTVTLAWTMAKLNSPSACGPDTKTMTIRYVAPPTLTINSTDISSCHGAGGFYRFEIPYTQTNAQVFDLQAVGPNPLPGFSNITNAAFVSPLRITYPASTPAGTYTFRMVARRTNLATCEVETFFTVRIETPSTLSSVSSNENTICIGNSATLTVTGTLGSNAQWVWYEGGCGSGTSIGTGASITVSPTSSTTYYVRAEGGAPCANTACGSVSVTVNQRPAFPDAGIDQENCNNPVFVLDAETPNVGTGRWILPAGVTFISGSILNPKSTVSVPVGQTVALGWTVTLGKCVVGPDTVLLTNLAPVVNNVIEEDQLICSGDQPEEITSVGTPTGGNGSYTYQWQRSTTSATSGFMNIGSATGTNYQPPALTQTTWYRRVVTSGACTSNSNAVEITVSTATPNIVSTPPDTSVQCYTGTDYTIYFGTPQFDHPEGLAIDVTYADVVTPAACGQTITRTWTATDACNKTTTTSQTITVIDTIKPRPVGPTPADTTVSCDAVPDPATFAVSDNCSAAADVDTVFTETRVNVTCANTYELLREWTLTDECGNDTVIVQRVYVIDTTHPVVVGPAPADTTVSCDAIPDPATFMVSDNCSASANIDTTFVETRTNGACANTYELLREWTLTDECGNDTVISQRIYVIDTTHPVVVGVAPRDTTVSCDAVPDPATFLVSDNCSVAANIDTSFVETRTNGACANTYELLRQWTLTDECGNDTVISQRIYVIDTTHPVVVGVAPRDTTVSCDAVPDPATFLVSDNCSVTANIDTSFVETRTNGACANTYELLRQWTLTDECGNDTVISQRIYVIDTTHPVVVGRAPADTTVSCDAVPDPATFQVSDNCSVEANIDTSFVETRTNGACANTYELLREWTLTDECGNDTIIRQRIYVVDTTHPVVVGRAPADTTVSCDAVPDPATFQVSDNCSVAANIDTSFVETRTNGACANTYELLREWRLTDECGNDTVISQRIYVIDTTHPVVVGVAPRDTTVSCDAVPDPATFQVSDNCSLEANIDTSFVETRTNGACANTYELLREWTLTDECGNDTVISQRIYVIDTTHPVVVGIAPRDTTVSCDAVPDPATFLVSDNCSVAANIDTVFTQTRTNGACANTYQLTRQWRLIDECGNDTIIRQIINVIDTTHPVVVGVAPRDTTVSCDAVPDPATFQVSDNCSLEANIDTSFVETRTNGACANTYELLRQWTLTDECGNDTVISQRIYVIDTTHPRVVGVAPRDTTVSCDAVPDPATFLVSDNCSVAANIDTTFVETRTNGACANTYELLREWTLTDECGNDTVISQRIYVIDTTHPVVVGVAPRDTTVSCDAVPDPATFLVSDNCSVAANIDTSFVETRTNGACANTYELLRQWTLTDECGNDTVISQRIYVIDTTHPVVVGRAPADTTVSCDAVPDPATFQVSDNCSVEANIDTSFVETRTNGACANTYELLREWTLTDECGNDTIIRQRIYVVDTTHPVVVGRAPADTTVSCDAVPDPATFLVSDNCSVAANIDTSFVETRTNGACANTYELLREWTLTDECGNDTVISQRIYVVDTTHPVVVGVAPRDTTVSCDAVPDPATFQVSDNCSLEANIDTSFVETRTNGACANTYELLREWTLTDECGNDTVISQRIYVIDTTHPVVVGIAPRDTTVSCDAVPDPATFLVSDNCSMSANIDTTFVETRTNGACANTYELLREWTLTDECGNDTIISQRIYVIDTTHPVVVGVAPRDTTVSCDAVPDPATFQVSDNCSVAANIDTSFVETRTNGACANTYELLRQWTLTDECGNDTVISQRIYVIDTTHPVVVGRAPADTTVSCDAVPDPATFQVSDNCSVEANIDTSFVETRTNGACANTYELLRQWTLTDECGNDTIISQRIHVIDTTHPVVVGRAPADTTVSCDAVPDPATFQVSDNCSVEANIDTSFVETRTNGACANTYELLREWTLTDECGNDTIIRQRIYVVDTTHPVVVGRAPADTTVSCDAVPDPATFLVSDNCSVAANIDTSFVETRINGACANTYELLREWTLTDECGNDTVISQRIYVIDTTNPRVVGVAPRDTTVSCDAVPDPATFLVSDNCSVAANIDTSFVETRTNGSCANTYELLREWTLTDECGNDTVISQRIYVIDTTHPRVVGLAPRDTTVSCDAVPDPATFLVSDNCSVAANIDTSFVETRTNGACANTYELLRQWTLTDECGNDTVISQRIYVIDTTHPRVVGVAPRDTTVSCDAVPDPATFLVSDNCSPSANIDTSFVETRTNGACANTYELLRQWRLTDECGNDTVISQRIYVIDTTHPRVVGRAPADTTVSCDAVPDPATFLVSDNCSVAANIDTSFVETRTNGACANTYELLREWTLTDECGNDTVISQRIYVVDTTHPVVVGIAPRDTTVSCDAVPDPATFLVSDNCSVAANIDTSFVETRTNGACANTYELLRQWTLTDECGNDTIISQRIYVIDTTHPRVVGVAPRDTTVSCDAVPDPATFLVSDNCSVAANIDTSFVETRTNGACANTYELLRQWTLTDECGNDTVISQRIYVIDTTHPRVVGIAPRDTTVSCDAVPDPATFLVSDNCSVAANIDTSFVETRTNGACANTYELLREWTLTDECGNDTVISQRIYVIDTTHPVVVGIAPRDTTVSCDAVPDPATFLVSDNCSAAANIDTVFTQTRTNGACANTYQLTRQWRLIDECGNDTIIRQIINVIDTTHPRVAGIAPRDTTVSCDAVPDPATFLVSDNCSVAANIDTVFTQTRTNGACANTYQLTRQWRLIDECGNDTVIRQIINVIDTTHPAVVGMAPRDTTVSCDAVPDPATFLVSDNCSVAANIDTIFTQTRTNGICANTYRLTRQWRLIDECGNDTIIRQIINVIDTTRPVVVGIAPRDTTVSCDAVPDPATFPVSDNCSAAANIDTTFTQTRINGTCVNTYQLVREWTLRDECGNNTIVRQRINVIDTTRPIVIGPAPRDTTVSCDAVPDPATFPVADNCSGPGNIDTTFRQTRINGACANTYQLVREWTLTDECGNNTLVRQRINVIDTTLPRFVLPLPANMTVECDNIPDQPDLDATDNCTSEVLVVKSETRQPLPGRCVNNYLIIRTWTAIDDCNNTITHTQTLTVIDTTAPVFDMIPPANITVACDSVPAQAEIDATDNCSADNRVTVTTSQVRVDGACANSYQLIRTWTAQDECGNTRVITQTVNVEDRRAPVFTTLPRDTVVSCDAVPAQPELTATDNCSAPANITITPAETRVNGTCANSYRLIRTWTAVDECGNTTQWTQNVTVEDRAKPVFFTPTPADTTVDCNAIPAPPVMRAKDNCTDTVNVNIAYTEEHIDITGACANNYRLLRRWTATDECGNATTVIQVIDVRDTTKPQFVSAAPADTIVNCHAIPAQPDIDATDNCSVTANIVVVAAERRENIPGACVSNYRLIRTWTATDECNNTTVMTQVITVQDTTRPVFTMATPANVTVECNAIPTQPVLTAVDNCSAGTGVTVTRAERMEQIPGAICTSNYRLIRTWTATDQCGNSSTVTQTITVVDNTAPTFTMSTPADVTVECNAIPAQPDLTATDNCTPSGSISIVKNERRENIPGACVNNYRLIRTWTATDLCGNETTVQQVITVRDITAPTFTQSVPADATVECSAIPVMPDLQVTDNCTPSNRVTVVKTERREDIPGACVNNYRLIRTWTATDECSNTRTVQQVLTVVDRTPPAFTIATPANATVECSAIPAQPDLAARDNCTTSPISIVKAERRENIPGACMNNYRLIRTWTATDECGNSAVVTQVLTVVDRTAPTFNMPVPADVTVECDAIPAQPDLTATDNCSAVNSINIVKNEVRENIPGACVNSYRLIRTWTATDECGNSATVRQVVTVQDRTAPVFTILPPANITVNCHEVPAAPVLTATDNCSGNNVTVAYSFRKQILSATCINNYRLTRTWTATDECGNQAVATQIVTVIDTTGPIFNAPVPQDMTVSCEAIPAPVIVTASDNCSRPGAVRVTHRQVKESIPGECTGNYRLINIWTARDECGNTSELRQVITVVDTTSPVIAMPPADITVPCGSPVPTADVRLMASDNCDPSFPKLVSYTTDPFVRDICNGYTIVRRWSVADACGNAAQEVTQRIIVLPCPKPELAADVIVNCSSNPFITLKTNGRVTRPVYTLVGVTPANAVRVPMTSSNPRFNVNGATSASFIVRDGATGCASDTMTYDITYLQMPVVNLGNDTSLCGGNGMVLDAGAANFGYQIQWSTGETTQRIRITQAGTYRVTVSNGMCTATDEITVGVIPMPLVNLPDTTICRGQNVILDASVPGASYLWSTGATTPSINVSTQEQFWVRVAKNGCITIDTINVTVNPPPDISLSRDTSICPGQSVLLTVSTDAGRIQWGTGEIGNSILVSKAGNYSVAVYRDNCVVREMVRVAERPDMKLDLGPDRIICPGGSILVDARHPDASTYRWNDGDLNPVKSFSQGGKYILGVLDRYCDRYKEDSFNVIVAGPPTVNLGNDTVICKGRRFMLKANAVNATSYLWSNGQTSSSIEITEPGTYSVTAFNDCGSTTDEITIDVKECDSRPDFPNAFSPNGDGNNDVFRPVVRGPMYDYELRIFNRWGELVFLSKDMNEGWNGWYKGRPVDIGTFVWWMTYKKVVNGPSFIIKGDVTVIR